MIKGIDVSHYQGDIDWVKVKADGVEYVWAKSSQGVKNRDDRFTKGRRKSAKEAGIPLGAYHFADLGQDAKKNAQNFADAIGQLEPGDLLPMVDVEDSGLPKGISSSQVNDWLVDFANEFNLHIKSPLVMYCGVGDWAGRAGAMSEQVKELYPFLWLCRYTNAKDPGKTGPWKTWNIWQYSSAGSVDGIKGNVDMNRMKGRDTLEALTVQSLTTDGPGN